MHNSISLFARNCTFSQSGSHILVHVHSLCVHTSHAELATEEAGEGDEEGEMGDGEEEDGRMCIQLWVCGLSSVPSDV